VVTGATSRLGTAAARLLAEQGAATVLVSRDRERGARVERELSAIGPAIYVEADVRLPEQVDRCLGEAEARHGGVDVLVASAGVGVVAQLSDTTLDDWRWIWETNVTGSLLAAQAAMRAMRRTGRGGSIVLVGSDAGLVGERSIGAYSVSKAAVVMMTRVLALDRAADGIRVNCVCPGFFEPGMIHFPDRAAAGEAETEASGYTDPPPPPLGRYGRVEEIARAWSTSRGRTRRSAPAARCWSTEAPPPASRRAEHKS
jgi:NAD(P)-dependent dehydrogenase (short-subunit alcohol dehydrogenase family)